MDEKSLRSFLTEFGSALVSAIKDGTTNSSPAPAAHVKPFCGKRDDNLTSWLFQVSDIFDSRNISLQDRLKYVSGYLGENALQWYLNLRQAAEKDPFQAIGSWDEFKAKIKSAFDTANSPFAIRRRIRCLMQDKSVQEYVASFRSLVGQLQDMHENDQILHFIEGLREGIKNELLYRQPRDLNEAIHLALVFESSKTPSKHLDHFRQQRIDKNYGSIDRLTSAPMEIGALKQIKSKVRCEFCRHFGHKEQDCRKKKAAQSTQGSAAALALEVAPQSLVHVIEEFKENVACNGIAANSMLIVAGLLEDIPVKALVDSGATHNFISRVLVEKHEVLASALIESSASVIHGVDGKALETCGKIVNAKLTLGNLNEKWSAFVIPIQRYDLIIGKPWLAKHNPSIDWRSHKIEINDIQNYYVIKGIKSGAEEGRSSFLPVGSRKEINNCEALICASLLDISPSNRTPEVDALISKHPQVFQLLQSVPPERATKHSIDTGAAEPVSFPYYRMSPAELESLKLELDSLSKKGFIRPSKSPWASPVLFVKKKDGTLRLCVDYRALNNLTVKHKFPIPRIDDLLDQLSGATIFSKLDLASGYYQIAVDPKDIQKTAFRTKYGQYEFTVMPFGLTNAPATFQQMMNSIFAHLLDICVVIYLDDIMVFSATRDKHVVHLDNVLKILAENNLFVKESKCSFFQKSIDFLGYTISEGTLSADAKKIQAIQTLQSPSNLTEVRSFLGMTGFYRRFIKDYAQLALPLTELLKESVRFSWSAKEEASFKLLKEALSSAPTLILPQFHLPFHVTCDASGTAIGAVLAQTLEDGIHPVAYESRKLTPAEQNYPVHELELLSIVHALKIWRCYLEGKSFVVFTDHASLQHLKTQKLLSRRVARWIEFLSIFDWTIKYKPGVTNVVADALSRLPVERVEVNMIHETDWPSLYPYFLKTGKIPEGESKDWTKKLSGEKESFLVEDDTVFHLEDEKRIPFCPFISRLDLVSQVHCGMGHLGGESTYSIIKERAWWPSMQKDIKTWVSACDVCQKFANDATKVGKTEKLHPIEPPVKPFSRWGIDFVGILPVTPRGNKWLLVAIDHSTRWPIAKAVHEATSHVVANFIYENIVCEFGCPDEVLSDRGSSFMSEVIKEFLSKLKTKHLRTTAYHPRTNGMVERLNGALVSIIRKYADSNPHSWDLFVNEALLAMRIRTHSTTGVSPFFLTYGVEPKIPGDSVHPQIMVDFSSNDETAESWRMQQVRRLNEERKASYGRFKEAQQKSKEDYDSLVSKESYQVNDLVYLKNENRTKFDKFWTGPFRVNEKFQNGTYKLANLTGDLLDKLVHGDRLKSVRKVTNQELMAVVATSREWDPVVSL
jgi:hypothetical protein